MRSSVPWSTSALSLLGILIQSGTTLFACQMEPFSPPDGSAVQAAAFPFSLALRKTGSEKKKTATKGEGSKTPLPGVAWHLWFWLDARTNVGYAFPIAGYRERCASIPMTASKEHSTCLC
jgi:hypothetical protein